MYFEIPKRITFLIRTGFFPSCRKARQIFRQEYLDISDLFTSFVLGIGLQFSRMDIVFVRYDGYVSLKRVREEKGEKVVITNITYMVTYYSAR